MASVTPSTPHPDIAKYLLHLRAERRLSENTLLAYAQELALLQPLLQGKPWQDLAELSVRKYVAQGSRDGLSARSTARRLSAWRGFYDWLAEHGLSALNPVRAVKAPKAPKRLPKAVSVEAAQQFIEHGGEESNEHLALRDQAMVELMYSSGLRLSELLSLDSQYVPGKSTSWLSLAEGEVTVTGKGNKTRTVPVGRKAGDALRQWMKVRSTAIRQDEAALFVALAGPRKGQRLTPRAVQDRMKQRSIQTGVAANVHPHVLRHSFASHVLQSSGDLRAVQDLLGHANITTTQVYTSLDFQRLAAVYDKAHPRAKLTSTKHGSTTNS